MSKVISFNKYHMYKDSGIEWIGEIPESWVLVRAKHLFSQSFNKGGDVLILLSATQNDGVIPKDRLEGVVQIKEDADLNTFKSVKKEDFVISLRSFQGGFEYSNFDGVITPAYTVFRSKKKICNNYFKKLFKSHGFIAKINSLTIGIREGKNIQYEDFAEMLLPLPDINEQQQIADYLDKKCGEIDRVVEVQKEVIEKLKEYKQSVITEAVTKGLDKSVPLKDSGIEWIGKIPQHWEIKKLKFITNCNTKVLDEKTPSETIINYIEIGSVTNENGINDFQTMLFENSPSRARRIVTTGDTILSTVRTYLKAIAYIDKSYDNFICSTGFAVFTPMQDILPKFLFHALHSEWFVSIVEANSVGISYPAINTSNILNYKISVPAIEEQEQILKYLDKKCFEIDSSISDKEQLIEKLTEYKKSLIYECVTGKRKVAGCHCEECK